MQDSQAGHHVIMQQPLTVEQVVKRTRLFNIPKALATTRSQVRVSALLSEHKDVFAQDKFDFGAFTEIHHGIQTEQSAPIKQTHAQNPSLFRP